MVEHIISKPIKDVSGNVIELGKEKDMEDQSNLLKNGSTNGNVVKIGIIGVGGWGKNHSRVLHDFGVLTSICDMDKTKAKDMGTRYNVNYYGSMDDMINSESLDACLVCTPTKTHYPVSKKLMEKGINVFVEKPLSYLSKECEEMIQIAKKNKVSLTCGYIERFNPAVQDVKKILSEKIYGELLMIEFHRENRMPLHIKDVGIIYDTAVHDIDTAIYLFGTNPQVVFARAGKIFHSFEDFCNIMLGFGKDRVAVISSNWITPKKVRNFSAVCTDAIINGDFIRQEITIEDSLSTTTPRRVNLVEPLSLELRNFLDVIEGKRDRTEVSAEEATNVTKIAEAALLSSNTGAPIYLNL
ncbi:MAG TPA: Gfo/Idh/MocA family oxidoreductase [Nitrososphaeraceae archaeon]|jgi:UDP-N-acetylglucosamine 3-dehydrogenase